MKKLLILILIISGCNSTPDIDGEYSCSITISLVDVNNLENIGKGLVNVSYIFLHNNTGILSYSVFGIKSDERFTWNKTSRHSMIVTLDDQEKLFIYNKSTHSWVYTTTGLREELKKINGN